MSLSDLIPTPINVDAGGKTHAILPLKVRQIPGFLRAIQPVFGPLADGNIAAALVQGGDSLAEAVAIATGQPIDWVQDLYPDDLLRLTSAIIEVNADFFVQRVSPELAKINAKVLALTTVGTTPSPSSLPEDTATPTASTTG
jgi:CelD/BcsL family acetyltransferase involved in cellulose biosynthesis